MIQLSIDEACAILDALGCSSDPITWLNQPEEQDYPVQDVDGLSEENGESTAMKIVFFGNNSRPLKGTLYDMVKERLGLKHKAKRLAKPTKRR